MKPQQYVARLETLEGDRRNWDDHWQEIAEVVFPRRADFTQDVTKGERKTVRVVDSTAVLANELLGAGLHGMLTNPSSKWFKLRLSSLELMEDEEVRAWLEEVERRIYIALNSPRANFSSHIHELYLDMTAFGTGVMFVGEDPKTGDLTFSTKHLKECYLAEDNQGFVDTVYRIFEFTARQIIQRWGIEKASRAVKASFDKGEFDKKFDILHAVQPRTDFIHGSMAREDMPVASVYLLKAEEHILEDGGFEEMPWVAPRWTKVSGETYGRGPGVSTLPDVKMLQEMAKTVIKAAQKVVDPPLLVPDDGALNPVRTVPGGLNFRRSGSDPITPLQTGGRIDIGLEIMNDTRQRIRSGFFIDQLQMQQGPQMTATEVLQRQEEKLRLMGPILGRLQSELLGPLVERVFGIMQRRGKFPPAPEILADAEYDIEYVSPLARAQRQADAGGLLRVFEIGSPILQMQPESAQIVNGEEAIRWLADMFGVPNSLIKTAEQMQALKQAQAEAQQQQQQMEQLQQGLAAAQQGADVAQTVGGIE
tara:strand:- start:13119 stop:14723 length:1605 start_codon:yes stop_codon:yes gene_type:complete